MKKMIISLWFLLSLNVLAAGQLSSYFVTSSLDVLPINVSHDIAHGTDLTLKIKSFNMLDGQLSLMANVVDENTKQVVYDCAMAVQCQAPGDHFVVYPHINARLMPAELFCIFKTKYLKKGSYRLAWNLFSLSEYTNKNQSIGSGFSPVINLK
ncbi:MAG: hypothetical protein A2381_16860 [Bdellovibrionales bacterium RIFOXYB1_FULL_37_110]|nr:MAG: hypothetical protein A2181_07865 [Bdellovibrionales bacterium RIFOXYA1_FULL_38_20]OFZ50069.1 MAG: hypothetical protein A2417_18695 [Bdellovibrionales bacterium RIFOXYC1_FULL_37_79]OFZ59975.1 MAG: hypothetical protein A2381_16860 [Bdellovibrionales bacterium RIFOXYB1_FULL_37_110]OFZ63946.1 MAG: hypothetical protein A2577_06050 [Bdellovibrionales bacterium RIFOXYD1_FULL_36_51]